MEPSLLVDRKEEERPEEEEEEGALQWLSTFTYTLGRLSITKSAALCQASGTLCS